MVRGEVRVRGRVGLTLTLTEETCGPRPMSDQEGGSQPVLVSG